VWRSTAPHNQQPTRPCSLSAVRCGRCSGKADDRSIHVDPLNGVSPLCTRCGTIGERSTIQLDFIRFMLRRSGRPITRRLMHCWLILLSTVKHAAVALFQLAARHLRTAPLTRTLPDTLQDNDIDRGPNTSMDATGSSPSSNGIHQLFGATVACATVHVWYCCSHVDRIRLCMMHAYWPRASLHTQSAPHYWELQTPSATLLPTSRRCKLTFGRATKLDHSEHNLGLAQLLELEPSGP
jgi:hypothetical protein